jgi:O-antigen/teichoic acid export membrane protein
VVPVSDSIYPHMIRYADYRLFWRVYLRGLLMWFAGCTLVIVWAPEMCRLILGPEFVESGPLLRVLAVNVFIAYSAIMFGYPALSPLGRAAHANYSLVVCAILAVAGYASLWLAGAVSPISVCVIATCVTGSLFVLRLGAFIRARPEWRRPTA